MKRMKGQLRFRVREAERKDANDLYREEKGAEAAERQYRLWLAEHTCNCGEGDKARSHKPGCPKAKKQRR